MTDKDTHGRFTPGNGYASIGGRRRAEALPPERRTAIARAGWQAVVVQRFGGDAAAAASWFGRLGAWAAERAAFGGSVIFNPVWEHPGPMPPREERRA